jgi:predicted nucleic acid-binding Zn ribbon protein
MTTWRPAGVSASARDPRPVADSLDRITRRIGAPRAELLAAVFARWEQLVGPDIAAHAQPRSLRDGVLVVIADQPAWATQLRYMAAELLDRIRAETAAEEIAEIQIRVGPPTTSEDRDERRRNGRRGGSRGRSESPPSGRM